MSKPAEDLIQRHRFTVADFHRLGERSVFRDNARVELVEGEIIDMTPIGSKHAAAVRRLDQILARAVGDGGIVSVQSPVVLGEYSEPEPDIALLRPRHDFYASAHPGPADVFLLIEVGDTSVRYDREIKIPLYARHGIPEVWLVDLEGGSLTIYGDPSASGYESVARPEPLQAVSVPRVEGVTLDLSDLFAQ